MIQRRNIALYIVLTLVTCGIFGLYWLVVLNNDCNNAAAISDGTSGGVVILLSIVTCGIYGLYWYYKMGQNLDIALQNRGRVPSNKSVILLVLSIFGLGIVSSALIQDDLNKISDLDNMQQGQPYGQP